jgi:hypothetical protein
MKRLIDFLKSKPLKWYIVLLLVAGAGPFAADMAILMDVITVLGTDVFFLSLLLYFREALFGWVRPCIARFRAFVEQKGLLWPDRSRFRSSQDFGRWITYNLDMMEVPLRVVACGTVVIAVVVSVGRLVA